LGYWADYISEICNQNPKWKVGSVKTDHKNELLKIDWKSKSTTRSLYQDYVRDYLIDQPYIVGLVVK
jgi:hypothetical protein